MREHYTIKPVHRKWADMALAVLIGIVMALFLWSGA